MKLDSLQIHLKQLKQTNGKVPANKKVYNELLQSFRTLVLGRQALVQTELTAYEKQYYKNNRLPTLLTTLDFVNNETTLTNYVSHEISPFDWYPVYLHVNFIAIVLYNL